MYPPKVNLRPNAKRHHSLSFFLFSCISTTIAQSFSNRGYPEHFAVGTAISGSISYLVFKKTDNKLKASGIGLGSAIAVGLIKELIDPAIGHTRNSEDFLYTSLGGAFGASIVIPLNRKNRKDKVPKSTLGMVF